MQHQKILSRKRVETVKWLTRAIEATLSGHDISTRDFMRWAKDSFSEAQREEKAAAAVVAPASVAAE